MRGHEERKVEVVNKGAKYWQGGGFSQEDGTIVVQWWPTRAREMAMLPPGL